jgi:hypothetical protein
MIDKTTFKSNVSGFLIVCIVFNFLIIFAVALLKYCEDSNNPIGGFFTFGFLMILILICLGLLIVAVIYFFTWFRKNIKRAIFPLLPFTIQLAFWLVPVNTIWSDLKFRLRSNSYNKIVEMVEDGRIQPNNEGLADLPPAYRHLSRGGDIFIEKGDKVTTVLFHTTFKYKFIWGRGAGGYINGFSGYLFRSDDTPPPRPFKVLIWDQVRRIRPNWFYYDSTIMP